jgi:hypothetical protein
MERTTLTVDVEYDPDVTDPEGLASAMDRLLETVLSTPGIMEDYANPRIGEFFVADTAGNSPRPRPTVVAVIAGGVLQEAYSSDPAVRLVLLDWDTDGCDPDKDNGIIEVSNEQGRSRCANVAEFPTVPITELSGTDNGQALEKAGIVCVTDHEDGPQVRQRWILYCFNTGTLLTTKVYDNYQEAADDANRVNDVLVLPLLC